MNVNLMKGIASFAAVAMAGCSGPAIADKQPEGGRAESARTATHCRILTDENKIKKAFTIIASNAHDYISTVNGERIYDFQIVRNIHIKDNSRLKLEKNDLLQVRERDSTSVTLFHTDSKGRDRSIATRLNRESSQPWIEGETIHDEGNRIGKYYLFLLEDSVRCAHRNWQVTGKNDCRNVRLEYYDDEDNDSKGHLPKLGENVFELVDGKCPAEATDAMHMKQTGEGDGDEGPA